MIRDDVVVFGAGPAGLATAACLMRRGIPPTVLERSHAVAPTWRRAYQRLRLHTPRVQSHLPGYPIPSRYGRWVAAADVVGYLEAYAAHFSIRPVFGVAVQRIDRVGGRWRITTSAGERDAGAVVVATGYNAVPHLPEWPGRDQFRGQLIHASDYRVPTPFKGRDVLVVGAGNTGAEIAVDLVEGGAARVHLAVRTPPHIVPRTVLGIPTALLGIPNAFVAPALGDPVNRMLQRLAVGDLSRHGMPRPRLGLITQHRRSGVIPTIDAGLIAQLQAGAIEPVAAVADFERRTVTLVDGTRIKPDVVITATGYRPGLEPLVGHLGVLDGHGRPRFHGGQTCPEAPRMYFVGLRNPLIGLLNAIRFDARRAAAAIARGNRHASGRIPVTDS